ncbi:hypothetical protein PC118_g4490 [Phytophthora cactorum]|uniref:Uncharacterized protein n=1 Tax=Phytophthora cactorum TaxID=29920 RepID=A0A8T1GJC5_9STRA|nr:hypothetical protein PC118_g4490 [Phytophthora cactorum]
MAFLTDDDDAFEAVLSFVDDFAADESLPDDGVVDSLETEEQLRGDELEIPTIEDMHLQVDGDAATCIEADAAPGLRRSLRLSQRTSGCSNVSADTTLPGSLRSIRRVAIKAKKKMVRKAGVYADPNRARNERKLEITYLREKVGQLETELQSVRERSSRPPIELGTLSENGRRPAEQSAAHASESQLSTAPTSPTTDCRVLRVDSEGLLQYLDDAYSQMREGVNGMYLEVFSNKVLPFGLHATAEATWNYFKGSKKHRGTLYAKEAQDLDTLYTVIEHFSKELVAGNSSTDVRIKQIVRRSPSAGVYGDPNRARNERKLEIAYLREKMGQLEKELQTLQERPDHTISERQESGSCATPCASAPTSCTETQVFSIWEGLAARQRGRREKAERENVRLKLVLEGQIKVAKSLENLLLKRAQQQIADCSSSIQKPGAICPPGRTLDFRADAADFQELLDAES